MKSTQNKNNTKKGHNYSTMAHIKRKLKKMIKKITASKETSYKGKFDSGKTSLFGGKVNRCWDVRLWAPFIVVFMIIINNNDKEVKPVPIEDPVIQVASENIIETEPEPTIDLRTSEIIALARLADTVAHGKSDEVKSAIMWIAINRVEDKANGYGLDLLGEIARPKQWQCYDENGTYLQSTYELAESVHDTWMNGGPRPIYSDMLWFVFNSDGSITIRNRFGSNEKNRSEVTFGQ